MVEEHYGNETKETDSRISVLEEEAGKTSNELLVENEEDLKKNKHWERPKK